MNLTKYLIGMLLVFSSFAYAQTVEEVVTSPTTFAVCKTVDVASTIHLLSTKAGAVEANPIVAKVIAIGGYPALIAVSVGLYFLIKELDNPIGTGVANAVTCGAAVNNLSLML